jgi:predicted Zn-dependent peptidase
MSKIHQTPAFKCERAASTDHDPLNALIYTLSNGMKLYMSVNHDEPRIFTNIAVRAGSKHDPSDTTGLAHYLEHMMFKGSPQIGALDWEREKILLKEISDLYEAYRVENDPIVRKNIYADIDRVSYEAAKTVAAGEFDRLSNVLGARATNAYTTSESTVFVNDVPSNELERWMQLESERFKGVTLRLFHTELETVYEEFNISQDNDGRKMFYKMTESLFPNHPYGTQTTLGKGEHLKNPSHVNIQRFFKTYYVPNNMAILLAGDFDPNQVIALAEKYFGGYEPADVPPFEFESKPVRRSVIRSEVLGQTSESVQLAWRVGGAHTREAQLLRMTDNIMCNRKAGLLDLNLLQSQKILGGSSSPMIWQDYSLFMMSGTPREGQTLEDVEKLLLEEVEKLKKGDFPEWLLEATVREFEYNRIKGFENNSNRVGFMTNSFTNGMEWRDTIRNINTLCKITKQDVMNFAQKKFKTNYAAIYKRRGTDEKVLKVEKPQITPVELNRSAQSDFAKNWLNQPTEPLKPVFVDFEAMIERTEIRPNLTLEYVKNQANKTFYLYFIFESGSSADLNMALAMNYLQLLGTNRYSPSALQREWYRLGLTFEVFCQAERSYISLRGLDESFEQGIVLLEHLLQQLQSDETVLNNMVTDILLRRSNQRKNKQIILKSAMLSYARHGADSPFTHFITADELRRLQPDELTHRIHTLTQQEHRIMYFGPKTMADVAEILRNNHPTPTIFDSVMPNRHFQHLETDRNRVLIVDFPMVQAEMMLYSKGTPYYNMPEGQMSVWYNAFFGSGLSSVVFQEIRESRALAYAASANYYSPAKERDPHHYQAFVGTQPDKLPTAITALREIIKNPPLVPKQLEQSRQSVLKQIESERVSPGSVYWNYRTLLDKGLNHDTRLDLYERMQTATQADMESFLDQYVRERHFTFLILGEQSRIDMNFLNKVGEVSTLSLPEIFKD